MGNTKQSNAKVLSSHIKLIVFVMPGNFWRLLCYVETIKIARKIRVALFISHTHTHILRRLNLISFYSHVQLSMKTRKRLVGGNYHLYKDKSEENGLLIRFLNLRKTYILS